MENEKIKEILLDVEDTQLDFTVIQTGKESKKVNGLYKIETHEILLHNKNFKSDNALIYTAVHEYTHHVLTEELINETGNPMPPSVKVHTQKFWSRFSGLLEKAEQKGHYILGLEKSPELEKLTEDIRKNYLTVNGKLMQEFGKLLSRAFELCEAADIRYEDYIDRVLCLPRTSAHDIMQLGAVQVNPALGYDNMKIVAKIRDPDKRAAAEEDFLSGKSRAAVQSGLKKSCSDDEDDMKTKLEKEKNRLEKTIASLTSRLEMVEEKLSNL